nr:unnamed protein product [Callosobruchus analis]
MSEDAPTAPAKRGRKPAADKAEKAEKAVDSKNVQRRVMMREHLLQNAEGVGQKVQQRKQRVPLNLKRRVVKDADVEGQRRRKKTKRTQPKTKWMKTKLAMIR